MAEKQAHLNGAYYGPSVLPTHQSANRPRRRGFGGGGGCCCCLFSFLLKLIISIVVIIGLAMLIFWLIVRPQKIKVHVTEATLTQWNYTAVNSSLNYDLALNISIRNPNKRIGVYYDAMELRGVYKNLIFESKFEQPFYQGHKNTTLLTPLFEGRRGFSNSFDTTKYNEETRTGVYKIDMDLYVRVRFKLGKIKTRRLKPRFLCELEVPLTNSNGTPVVAGAAPFKTTKCDFDW